MNWLSSALCAVLGLLTTLVLIPVIRRRSAMASASAEGRDFHHTHKSPISRFGGVALAAAFAVVALVVFFWFPADEEQTRVRVIIVGSSLAMFLLGLRDDFRPLGARKKLLGQILISLGVCFCGVQIEKFQDPFTHQVHDLGAWGWLVTVGWLVGLTNMINLIDGIDGLAGGIALMMMGLLAFVGGMGELVFPVLAAAGMFGALLGFLRYNFPPAKIYMGDGGAYFLGFLIAILTLVHSQKGTILAALIAPLFALALPIVDVSLAILRRGLKGLPIFRPDRRHIHHRMQELGMSRTRTVLILYGISSVFLLMAFGVFWSQGRWVPILFGFLCLTLILSARSFHFSRDWFAVGRVLENSLELRKETYYALSLSRWLELEAERAATLDDLWADFTFALRKMKFSSVTLHSTTGNRQWHSGISSVKEWQRTHELSLSGTTTIEFRGDSAETSERVFAHLSELSAECWLKAANRWHAANPTEILPVVPPATAPVSNPP